MRRLKSPRRGGLKGQLVELAVETPGLQQLLVSSGFDDPAVIQHDDQVRILNR